MPAANMAGAFLGAAARRVGSLGKRTGPAPSEADAAVGFAETAATAAQAPGHLDASAGNDAAAAAAVSRQWSQEECAAYMGAMRVEGLQGLSDAKTAYVRDFLMRVGAQAELPGAWSVTRDAQNKLTFVNMATYEYSERHPLEQEMQELARVCAALLQMGDLERNPWLQSLRSNYAAAADWRTVPHEGGQYYCNPSTGDTRWDDPAASVLPACRLKLWAVEQLSLVFGAAAGEAQAGGGSSSSTAQATAVASATATASAPTAASAADVAAGGATAAATASDAARNVAWTPEECAAYVAALGICRLPDEEPLLQVLANALLESTLPASWTSARGSQGELIFANTSSGETSRSHPLEADLRAAAQIGWRFAGLPDKGRSREEWVSTTVTELRTAATAAANEWRQVDMPTGPPYYVHEKTGVSSWDAPVDVVGPGLALKLSVLRQLRRDAAALAKEAAQKAPKAAATAATERQDGPSTSGYPPSALRSGEAGRAEGRNAGFDARAADPVAPAAFQEAAAEVADADREAPPSVDTRGSKASRTSIGTTEAASNITSLASACASPLAAGGSDAPAAVKPPSPERPRPPSLTEDAATAEPSAADAAARIPCSPAGEGWAATTAAVAFGNEKRKDARADESEDSPPPLAQGKWTEDECLSYVLSLELGCFPQVSALLAEVLRGSPLPEPWLIQRGRRGKVYFANPATLRTSWQHPLADSLQHLADLCRDCFEVEGADREERVRSLRAACMQEAEEKVAKWTSYWSESGQQYHVHVETQETMWASPVDVILPEFQLKLAVLGKLIHEAKTEDEATAAEAPERGEEDPSTSAGRSSGSLLGKLMPRRPWSPSPSGRASSSQPPPSPAAKEGSRGSFRPPPSPAGMAPAAASRAFQNGAGAADRAPSPAPAETTGGNEQSHDARRNSRASSLSTSWTHEECFGYLESLSLAKLPQENVLVRLLVESILESPLPPPWVLTRGRSGRAFFMDKGSSKTTWQHPLESIIRGLVPTCRECLQLPQEERERQVGAMRYELEREAETEILQWEKVHHRSGRLYYLHSVTKESRWEDPADIVLPAYRLRFAAFVRLINAPAAEDICRRRTSSSSTVESSSSSDVSSRLQRRRHQPPPPPPPPSEPAPLAAPRGPSPSPPVRAQVAPPEQQESPVFGAAPAKAASPPSLLPPEAGQQQQQQQQQTHDVLRAELDAQALELRELREEHYREAERKNLAEQALRDELTVYSQRLTVEEASCEHRQVEFERQAQEEAKLSAELLDLKAMLLPEEAARMKRDEEAGVFLQERAEAIAEALAARKEESDAIAEAVEIVEEALNEKDEAYREEAVLRRRLSTFPEAFAEQEQARLDLEVALGELTEDLASSSERLEAAEHAQRDWQLQLLQSHERAERALQVEASLALELATARQAPAQVPEATSASASALAAAEAELRESSEQQERTLEELSTTRAELAQASADRASLHEALGSETRAREEACARSAADFDHMSSAWRLELQEASERHAADAHALRLGEQRLVERHGLAEAFLGAETVRGHEAREVLRAELENAQRSLASAHVECASLEASLRDAQRRVSELEQEAVELNSRHDVQCRIMDEHAKEREQVERIASAEVALGRELHSRASAEVLNAHDVLLSVQALRAELASGRPAAAEGFTEVDADGSFSRLPPQLS